MLPLLIKAQVLSEKGRFSVEFDRGCVPMTVHITELDTFSNNSNRQYYYEEGLEISNSKTHTYIAEDTYNIVQLIQGIPDTLQVQVYDSYKPHFHIEKCGDNKILITSQETDYDFIRVYFTVNDSVQLNFNESTQFSFSSNTQKSIEVKGFFTNADNKCSYHIENIQPISTLNSPKIVSISVKESCVDQFNLNLDLESFDSTITYEIELHQKKIIKLYEGLIKKEQFSISNISFSKSEENYCIKINALDACNSSRVEGEKICLQSSNLSLSPFESLYSSYNNHGIQLNIDSIESGFFDVFRKRETLDFQKIDSITSSFTDTKITNSRKYYYKIDYIDSCKQILYSAETNPPFIESQKKHNNTYTVKYLFPQPINDGIYFLETIVGNEQSQSKKQFKIIKNQELKSYSFDINLNAKDGSNSQILTTKLHSISGVEKQSNSINLKFELEIYVPTAFTPNNDGLNDTLELFGIPSNTAEIKIYSKWGHLIYSSNSPTPGWDGMVDGKLAPEGTYLYEIIFESTQGEKLRQKGTFALITK